MAAKKMTYVRLGNSDLNVSRIILGTMQYGNSRWQPWVLEEEEALKHITRAYDHGITTFDTESKRGNVDWFINRYKNQVTVDIVSRVEELAKKKGISMAQVAVAWILAKPHVTAPIVGTTSLNNLEDILGGLDVDLSGEKIKYLEEPYKPMAITGHFQVASLCHKAQREETLY